MSDLTSQSVIKETISDGNNIEIVKLYKYRFVVLAIVFIFTFMNFFQLPQVAILSNVMEKYYNVSEIAVVMTTLMFFIVFIFLFIPVSYLIEIYSLKITCLSCSALTFTGCLLKIAAVSPDRFGLLFLGQTICALAQIYILSMMTKFASTWFGPDELSQAVAMIVFALQLGTAIGNVVPAAVVEDGSVDEVSHQMYYLLIINAFAAGIAFFLVVFFFRSKPPHPPSQSQLQQLQNNEDKSKINILRAFKSDVGKVLQNRDFLVLLIGFGLVNGTWNSFGVLLNPFYLNHFPDGQVDAGIVALIAIISGGCFGSIAFGWFLDKTKKFKLASIVSLSATLITYILLLVALNFQSRVGVFIIVIFFGFFTGSSLVIGVEYSIEVTYPMPEVISCSILNGCINLLTIVISIAEESLLDVLTAFKVESISAVLLAISLICSVFFSNNLRRLDANKSAKFNSSDSVITSQTTDNEI